MPKLQETQVIARVMLRRQAGGTGSGEPEAARRQRQQEHSFEEHSFEELGPFEGEAAARKAALEGDAFGAGVVVRQQWRYPRRPRWVDISETYTENA